MSVYMTEQEQLEAIKKWWKQHSTKITVLISVILLLIAGYRYWSWHEQKKEQLASSYFEQMMVSFSQQDNKKVRSYANQLIQEYKNTVYSDAAHLTLAKIAINHEKYQKAKEELTQVADHGKVPDLKQVAAIRLSRIYIAEKNYDLALKELAKINDKAYVSVINELKGDIYAATGEFSQAVNAYRLAIQEAQMKGVGNLFLEMKTNELIALSGSANHEGNPSQTV